MDTIKRPIWLLAFVQGVVGLVWVQYRDFLLSVAPPHATLSGGWSRPANFWSA